MSGYRTKASNSVAHPEPLKRRTVSLSSSRRPPMPRQLLRIVLVSAISTAANVRADTTAQFRLPSGVDVRIVEAPFEAARFRVEGCKEGSNACLIDGRVPFGNAFGMPTTYVRRIVVSFKGREYLLEASQMYNAWGQRPLEFKGAIRYFGGRVTTKGTVDFEGSFPMRAVPMSPNGLSRRAWPCAPF